MSGLHPLDVDPRQALDRDRALVAMIRGRLDGITLTRGWASARWNPQALTEAAYLSADAQPLDATVRDIPLGVVNPIELAEQLATVDHAWEGNFYASLSTGTRTAFAIHGIDASLGPARFEEGLQLVRTMWKDSSLVGIGPQFRFAEVYPTLRPANRGGPPLSLEISDPEGLALAVRHGLGVHVLSRDDMYGAGDLIELYRRMGGKGEVSVELGVEHVTTDWLQATSDRGLDQVDVRLPAVDGDWERSTHAVDDLIHRVEVIRGP
jgi:alkanesulfonate monooxygenase SsuD/methylene tetrahydromethanopterin reductase-like flavin-dependent oxidoreductase (luciferase family)